MIEYLRNWFWTYIWKPLPDMPFGDWMESFIRWARDAWATGFDAVDSGLEFLYVHLADGLLWLPSGVMVLLFAAVAWAAKGWKLGVGIGLGMFVVAWTPYWEQTMQTLSMVLVSAAIAILLAIPLGIAAAESKAFSAVARPVLDFMQTLPAFVYLIPVVMLFSVGVVPGIIATIIFAMPPGVRLTELGLRQVDREVVEAGQAFGASPARILARIKLPLALPTIMAGLNQVIMLALSMVVIAGLVGGGGLGSVISGSLGRLDIAAGFNAGLAVVLLAILLDRVTQGLSDRTPVARAAKLAR
ncbi:ABC transporter permease subunit [Glycomyces luteolus]|uniref:ABC transporter permease subunit n=1 Tax=Glycomyces luteolus TaxID=2670330 RepID=A0A9X3PBV1_9ACTN|nr:ABC transporter permease subunit [Glycomyces luteolus]MDA1360797.1 ABC transporter permease subunit [Glycomyces luteolus]